MWCIINLATFSVPFSVGILGPHTVLPISIRCPIVFSWISLRFWNLFLSEVILVWGKARSHRVPNLGCRGSESPGWLVVSPKNSAWDVMHEQIHCPVYNVSCILFNKCLYFSYYIAGYLPDEPCILKITELYIFERWVLMYMNYIYLKMFIKFHHEKSSM